jgi:hypothetical protein
MKGEIPVVVPADYKPTKPVHGFFHVAAMLGGELIAAELHGRLMQSGLYEASTAIHVVIVGDTSQKDRLVDYIFSRHDKYDIFYTSSNLHDYEWPALCDMHDAANDVDMNCFYIHTKGASNCRPDVPVKIQENIRRWRDLMCYCTIGKFLECQYLLDSGHNTVGPLFKFGRHYAGNFWWTKSEHLKTLPYPEGNRMQAESWVTQDTDKGIFNQYAVDSNDLYGFDGNNPFKEYTRQ